MDNILIWAKREGGRNIPEIEEYLDSTVPFNKRGSISANNRKEIRALGLEEAKFGAIGFNPEHSMEYNSQIAEKHYQESKKKRRDNIILSIRKILSRFRHEGWRSALRELLWSILERL